MSNMVERHTKAGRFMHWFNAACWFFLLASGLGLIENPELQPLGQGYVDFMRGIFGGGAGLLWAHLYAAAAWLLVWAVYFLLGATKYVIPFIIDIFSINPSRDTRWLVKKNLQMTLGYKAMAKMVKPLGWDGKIPEQGYYNAGQKLAAQVMLLGALALMVTGGIMASSRYLLEPDQVWLVQWSITLHYLSAGLTTAILILHIYMAAISRDERPAFFSMFSGRVPEEYAKHHHKLWWETLHNKNGKQ